MGARQGQQVAGRYVLRRRLGEGGFGEVWAAEDVRLGSEVAVKLVKPQWAGDPQHASRAAEEARLTARISHPGVVRVLDAGRDRDAGLYLVAELVHGRSVAERLQIGPFSVAEACRVAAQVCDALQAAHARGVVHRDVKPSNVLLDARDDDRAKLTDFGIARLQSGMTSKTTTQTIIGTPSYMSPEQADGRGVGPAADLYAVGVLLFEMLTGRLPFQADTPVAMAVAHLTKPVPPLPAPIPDDVAAVVRAAMAKQPDDRPENAARMAVDLRTAASSAARRRAPETPTAVTDVLPDSQPTRRATVRADGREARQPGRGRRLAAAAAVVLLAGGAAVAAGLGSGDSKGAPSTAQADAEPRSSSSGETATREPVPPDVEQTTVPTLTGISEQGARARAERHSLILEIRRRDSVRVPEGQVVRQTPARGARVDEGSTVRVTVSDGPPPVTVPSVTGESVSVAVGRLQSSGLQVRQTTRSSARPPGTVIKTNPAAGTSLPPGSTVRLVVAATPTWRTVATHTFTASGSTGPLEVPTTARKARITYTLIRPAPDEYLVMDMYIEQPEAAFESLDIKDGTHETNVGLNGSGELELQLNEYSDEGAFELQVTVEVLA